MIKETGSYPTVTDHILPLSHLSLVHCPLRVYNGNSYFEIICIKSDGETKD